MRFFIVVLVSLPTCFNPPHFPAIESTLSFLGMGNPERGRDVWCISDLYKVSRSGSLDSCVIVPFIVAYVQLLTHQLERPALHPERGRLVGLRPFALEVG